MATRRLTPREAAAREAAEAIPEVPWAEALEHLGYYWEQGQHVTMLGRNGSGKTTAAIQVLDVRKYVIVLLTKRRDDLFPLFKQRGYRVVTNLDDLPEPEHAPKVALHLSPEGLTRDANRRQARLVNAALHHVWDEGRWTLYIDEIAQLSDLLGLDTELRSIWKEARSSYVSLVAGTQRPSRIPLEAYSQARYLLLWRTNDRDQQKRLSEMNAVDPEPVRAKVAMLDRHEILIVDTYEDAMVTTRPPMLR